MLTLQNEPSSLESVAEEKDQYKNYGKSIRKMICDCLQKDPCKRPTATDLLKHQFFRKAKDKKYLIQTLLSCAPSIEERAKKAKNNKRAPGTSGRLHRTETGDWVWSSDDEYLIHVDNKNWPTSSSSGSSGTQSNYLEKEENLENSQNTNKINEPELKVPLNHEPREEQNGSELGESNNLALSPPTINLVLRIRNAKKELNDIRFEYSSDRGECQFVMINIYEPSCDNF